jgi:MFS family permease
MYSVTREPIFDATNRAESALPYDRAWGVLLGASLCMFCGTPAVVYYTFGVFLPEIIAATHWSGAAVAAAIGPGTLIAAVAAPVIGRMSDKFGVRVVAMLGGPALAIGLSSLGLFPQSARGFQGWTMLMWLLAFSGSPVPYAQALTGWFDRRRGMAISIMFCSGAIGIALWPPYAAFLITHLGWRHAYVVMGVSAGAVIFLAGLFLLKKAPSAVNTAAAANVSTVAAKPIADGPSRPSGLLAGEALKTSRFWKTAAIFLLLTAVLGGTAATFPVILRQRGADAQTAAAIMSVIGVSMFLGRVLLGLMLDRWFAPRITIAITIVPILGFLLLMFGSGKLAFFAAAAFLGFGLGSEYAVAAYMISRAFGFRAYGAIYGLISVATNIGAAAGPAVIGVSLVVGIGARTIFSSAIALLMVAIVILLTLGKKDLPFGRVAVS